MSTILIVEDDETISYILEFMLKREGYEVLPGVPVPFDHDPFSPLLLTLNASSRPPASECPFRLCELS